MNLDGRMSIKLNRKAVKFLSKQEVSVNRRIRRALEGLTQFPPEGDIVKLRGKQGLYRLRIGTFRAIFQIDIEEGAIYVLAIDNRGDIY